MKSAKEFVEFLVENPDVADRLSSLSPEEMSAAIKDMGYSVEQNEIASLLENSEELGDLVLANSVSGGICKGHCGVECEEEHICDVGDLPK